MSRVDWQGEGYAARAGLAIDRAVTDMATVAQRQMIVNLSAAGPSKPGQYPGVETGRFRQSIAVNPPGSGKPHTAQVGSNLARARTLEFGGFINAKGKMLTIPLTRDAKLIRRRLGSLRSVPGLKVFKTKTGKLFLGGGGVRIEGVKRKYSVLFRLVNRVFIAARPWAMRSMREASADMVTAFKTSLRRSLGKGRVS